MENQNTPGSGKAVASLVLGILAILGGGLLLGIIGIVLGNQAKKSLAEAGAPITIAQAGFICSVVGTVLGSILFIFIFIPAIIGITGAVLMGF